MNKHEASRDLSTDLLTQLVYRDGGTIHFHANVSVQTCCRLQQLIREAEKEILRAVKDAEKRFAQDEDDRLEVTIAPKPIQLYVSSDGGDVYSAWSVVDTILTLKVPVHTVVIGYVASAGTMISLSGARRFMTKNSAMLIHEIRTNFGWQKYTSMTEQVGNVEKLMNNVVRFYSERTGISVDKIKDVLSKDVDWNADECLENNLIHEIMQ